MNERSCGLKHFSKMKRFQNVTTFSFLTRKTQCIIHVSKHMAEEQTATCGRTLKVSNKFVMY